MTSKANIIQLGSNQYHKNNFNVNTFLGKTTVIAGTSGSGKSFVLNDILKSISKHVRLSVVFSGTSNIDKTFPMSNYTHQSLIYNTIDINALSNIVDKSYELTEKARCYTESKVVEVSALKLKKILKGYENSHIKAKWDAIKREKEVFKNLVQPSKPVIDKQLAKMVEIYKKIITMYKKIIIKKNIQIVDPVLVKVLKFIDFNENINVTFNDLTDEYDALPKKEKGIFNAIFNKGRHIGITMIMLIHTWNGFGTTIRNSANNIIYTSPELLNSYVGAQKMKQMESKRFIDALNAIIIKDRALAEEARKYSCILYIKDKTLFEYIQADPRGKQVYVGINYFNMNNKLR